MNWSDTIKKRQAAKLKRQLEATLRTVMAPPPKLSISQWADNYRQLSSESSAEAGKWSTRRAEYQRGMMDAVSDPNVETVVLMTAAQIGKTELINNVVGFHIHQDPAPMLVVQPTLEMAQTWSKDRLAPAIRDTPVLSSKIANPRSRDSGNTTLHKVFAGGHVTACGANSPSSLASRPCRIILCDEIDRYPISAGTEGDPVALARKRSATFWNRKIIMVSTPTEKGASRIERAFEHSDQRKYFVPCPDCGERQNLKWSNVQWTDGKASTAEYCCEHCGSLWGDAKRFQAIRYGQWKATAEGDGKTAGFHLSALYSPWTPLEDIVTDFLQSKRDPMRLKAWVNTTLGECYEEEGERIDEYDLFDSGRGATLFEDAKAPFDGSPEVQAGAEIQVGASDSSLASITSFQKIAQQSTIKGRYFKFRCKITSDNNKVRAKVHTLQYKINFEFRTESGEDVVASASGQAITFTNSFYATPSIGISAQGLQTGDYYQITSKSKTGFTIRFYNSSNTGISRTFDYQVFGYGLKS